MITGEALARFSGGSAGRSKPKMSGHDFDMDRYLAKHGFEGTRRKPWQSHPGGLVFELTRCPFNADHTDGSAAFTETNGVPGFDCKHDGCHGKAIKDIFARYTP